MRLVHIRLRAGAFARDTRRKIVRRNLAVVVTIWLRRLIAELHCLEDKIVVVELKWSAANSEKSCVGNPFHGENLADKEIKFGVSFYNFYLLKSKCTSCISSDISTSTVA